MIKKLLLASSTSLYRGVYKLGHVWLVNLHLLSFANG